MLRCAARPIARVATRRVLRPYHQEVIDHSEKPLNDAMKKMAIIPAGAEILDVGGLWFPVVVVENVHIFPGIPELFEKKFHSIADRFSGVPFVLRKIFVRESESDIADTLNSLLREYPELMLGSYPKINEEHYRVMLTLESRDAEYVARATEVLGENRPADAIHKVE